MNVTKDFAYLSLRSFLLTNYKSHGDYQSCYGSDVALLCCSPCPKGYQSECLFARITDDSIVNALPKEAHEAILSWLKQGWIPLGRPGTTADIGGTVAALFSQEAGWITGQTIVADCGALLMNSRISIDFQILMNNYLNYNTRL